MKVVVAIDKFKGSLTGAEAADAVRRGVLAAHPDADVVVVPVADGGDGTLDAALAAGFTHHPVRCDGPLGEPVTSGFAQRGRLAVVELADSCGLLRLGHPVSRETGLSASTRGLGQVLRAALDAGATEVVVGLGGSASTDGGAGMLAELEGVDLAGVEMVVASDVDSPLLGPRGAARVFGPQKGLDEIGIAEAEARVRALADNWEHRTGRSTRDLPGAGAAGGAGWALLQLGATMRSGIEVVLEWSDAATHFARADLVITGEGRADSQTLAGKSPAGVARLARRLKVPVALVAGRIDLTPTQLRDAGITRHLALTGLEPDPERCLTDAATLLEAATTRLLAQS